MTGRALTEPAATARLALERAMTTARDRVPCTRDPEAWFAPDTPTQALAAAECPPCPVLDECGTYARTARERHGVWAGVDRQAPADDPDDAQP